jgi:hypothetical protein
MEIGSVAIAIGSSTLDGLEREPPFATLKPCVIRSEVVSPSEGLLVALQNSRKYRCLALLVITFSVHDKCRPLKKMTTQNEIGRLRSSHEKDDAQSTDRKVRPTIPRRAEVKTRSGRVRTMKKPESHVGPTVPLNPFTTAR